MKKVNPILFLLLIHTLFTSSCIESVTGEGPVVSVKRKTADFSSIALNLGARVKVTQGNENMVIVTAHQNLTDRVITRVDGRTLVITSKGTLVSKRPVQIEVRMRNMENFEINGSGEMEFEETIVADYVDFAVTGSGSVRADLDVRKVSTVVTGSGTVDLSGKTPDLHGEVLGSGTINASALSAQHATFKLAGSGEVYTTVNDLLEVSLTGSGEVHYSGDPQVKMSVSGSGKVIRNPENSR